MCSFGYVICDESFSILEKEDIVMDPEDKFDYYLFKKDSKINLAYSKEYYYMQSPFIEYASKIKKILTDAYDGIFGFSVKNDLKYVYQTYQRYNYESFEVKAYDVREIVKAYNKTKKGLLQTALTLDRDNSKRLQAHSSEDDAHLTLNVLKAVCDDLEMSIDEVLELSEVKEIKYEKNHTSKQIKQTKKKQDPETLEKNKIFNGYYDKINNSPTRDTFGGKTVGVSVQIKKEIDIAVQLARYLYDHGAIMVRELRLADIMVVKDRKDKERLEEILDTRQLELITLNKYI